MSLPLSVKHAAEITFAQYKCRTFRSIIYPADKNNFIGISSILAWSKSRVGLPPPFIAMLGQNLNSDVKKITKKITRRNVFEQKKRKPG